MISFALLCSYIASAGTLATVTAGTVGAAKKLWRSIWH